MTMLNNQRVTFHAGSFQAMRYPGTPFDHGTTGIWPKHRSDWQVPDISVISLLQLAYVFKKKKKLANPGKSHHSKWKKHHHSTIINISSPSVSLLATALPVSFADLLVGLVAEEGIVLGHNGTHWDDPKIPLESHGMWQSTNVSG